jgi:nucleotide-binding universal stress UspA family protein
LILAEWTAKKEGIMDGPENEKPIQILFACDGSEHSMAATALLNDLPLPAGSSITLFGVMIPREAASYNLIQSALQKAKDSLKTNGISVQVEQQTGYPAERIIEYAAEGPIDLIILGAKGLRHTWGILLGGVAQQVVEYSSTPVLVVRAPYTGLRKILLATDGSACSQCMLEFLGGADQRIRFPLPTDAEIKIANVTPQVGAYYSYLYTTYIGPNIVLMDEEIAAKQSEEDQLGKEILQEGGAYLHRFGIEAEPILLHGDAATEIIDYAKGQQIDLIVSGSRGLSTAKSWLLGSVSRKLVHYAGSSVMVVK